MIEPIEVEPRDGFRIWLRYSDGATGEVDLSDVAGRGVFATWNEPGVFDRVHISRHRSIAWDDEIELCPDALYMEITGTSLSELPPSMTPKQSFTGTSDMPYPRHRHSDLQSRSKTEGWYTR